MVRSVTEGPRHKSEEFVHASLCYRKSANLIISLITVLLFSPLALALSVTSGPTLTMNPNVTTPLAGMVELTTDVPTRVRLNPGLNTKHIVPVLGLKPADTYTINVTVIDQTNTALVATPALNTMTDPLPSNFPRIDVLASNPAHMEPGFTLLRVAPYAIILDATGDVVWYSDTVISDGITLGVRLPSGHFLQRRESTLVETDLLGNIYKSIEVPPEIPDSILHHDLFRTASGSFLSLTFKYVSVPSYPTSDTDPDAPMAPAIIRDTPVVEFNADGVLLSVWDFASMLDTTRIGYGSLVRRAGGSKDWLHGNAVIEDPKDGNLIASLRHQDAVIKFSRTGQLIWILGPHANWGPTYQAYLLHPVGRPFEWQYHQHNMTITPQGTLLMFDNGNYRASPFDGTLSVPGRESYSRAVEYAINEDTMEIQQIWEYGSPETAGEALYSIAQSGTVYLPQTRNILTTFGVTVYTDGVRSPDLDFGDAYARIIETDHAPSPNTLFDVRLYRPSGRVEVYRSHRIPSLYTKRVTCRGLEATIMGTEDDDVLYGTAGKDVIVTQVAPLPLRETKAEAMGNDK